MEELTIEERKKLLVLMDRREICINRNLLAILTKFNIDLDRIIKSGDKEELLTLLDSSKITNYLTKEQIYHSAMLKAILEERPEMIDFISKETEELSPIALYEIYLEMHIARKEKVYDTVRKISVLSNLPLFDTGRLSETMKTSINFQIIAFDRKKRTSLML